MTHAGVILGTAAYMAPEQACGRLVDKHADIWAFGVVLYEMLTGRRPFDGDGLSETLVAIIKSEPGWSALPPDTPFLVRRLLRHCLAKDHRQRLGDIRDARLEIADALFTPAPGPQSSARRVRRERVVWIGAAAGALAAATVLALFAVGVIRIGTARADPQMIRLTIEPPAGVINTGAPMISPDGRRLVFAAGTPGRGSILWVRSMDSVTAQPLAGTEGAVFPFWSPESRFVGVFAGGMLKKVDVDSGTVVALCEAPAAGGGSWSQAGIIVYASTPDGLQQIPAGGGTPVQLTTVKPGTEVAHLWPQFLSDERHFLYVSVSGAIGTPTEIHLATLDSPGGRPVVASDTQVLYVSPDTLLFVRGRTAALSANGRSKDPICIRSGRATVST